MPAPMVMSLTQTSDLLEFAQEAFNLLVSLSPPLGECQALDQVLSHPGAEPFMLQRLRSVAA